MVYEKEIIEKTFSSEFISTFIIDNDKTIKNNKLFEDIIKFKGKKFKFNLLWGKSDFVLPIFNNYLAQFNKEEKNFYFSG